MAEEKTQKKIDIHLDELESILTNISNLLLSMPTNNDMMKRLIKLNEKLAKHKYKLLKYMNRLGNTVLVRDVAMSIIQRSSPKQSPVRSPTVTSRIFIDSTKKELYKQIQNALRRIASYRRRKQTQKLTNLVDNLTTITSDIHSFELNYEHEIAESMDYAMRNTRRLSPARTESRSLLSRMSKLISVSKRNNRIAPSSLSLPSFNVGGKKKKRAKRAV